MTKKNDELKQMLNTECAVRYKEKKDFNEKERLFDAKIDQIQSRMSEMTVRNDEMKSELECPICYEEMKPPRKMKLWLIEHSLNTFSKYMSSKLDSPLIKILERENLILMIDMLKKCSTCVQLVRVSSFRNDLLQNPYFRVFISTLNISVQKT